MLLFDQIWLYFTREQYLFPKKAYVPKKERKKWQKHISARTFIEHILWPSTSISISRYSYKNQMKKGPIPLHIHGLQKNVVGKLAQKPTRQVPVVVKGIYFVFCFLCISNRNYKPTLTMCDFKDPVGWSTTDVMASKAAREEDNQMLFLSLFSISNVLPWVAATSAVSLYIGGRK